MRLYKPKEVAQTLRVSDATIRNMIRRGDLPAIKLPGSRTYRITEETLSEFLKGSPIKPINSKPSIPRPSRIIVGSEVYSWPKEFRSLSSSLQRIIRDGEMTLEFISSLTRKEMGRFRGVGESKLKELDNLLERKGKTWYSETK